MDKKDSMLTGADNHGNSEKELTRRQSKQVKRISVDHYQEPYIQSIHPFKNKKLLVWDIWIVIFSFAMAVGYIPYFTAFVPPQDEHLGHFLCHRLIDVFFLLELILHFFVTVFDENEGRWVRNFEAIAQTYMYHWGFAFDIIMVVPWDIFSSYFLFPSSDIRLIYRLRMLNFIRPMKILRLKSWERVMRRFESSHGVLSAWVTGWNSLALMLVLSHLGACIWGVIPRIEDFQNSWLAGPDAYDTQDPYISALYWAFMTLTSVGYGDVPANSVLETLFAIIFMLLSGAFYARIVGDIISAKTELELTDMEYKETIDNLNSFMSDSQMEKNIQVKFRTFFLKKGQAHIKQRYYRRVMRVMSPGLQTNVVRGYTNFWLDKVPAFKIPKVPKKFQRIEWQEEKNVWEESAKYEQLELAAHLLEVMKLYSYPAEELVIHQGEAPNRMYILKKGMATLRKRVDFSGRVLQPGDVFGDDIILSHGRRQYSVQSLTFIDVAFIERSDLQEVLARGDFPKMKKQIRRHAIKKALKNEIYSIARQIKKKKSSLSYLKTEFQTHKLKLRITPPAYIPPQKNLSDFILPGDSNYDGVRVLLEYVESQIYNNSAKSVKNLFKEESMVNVSRASSMVRDPTPPMLTTVTTMTTMTTMAVPETHTPAPVEPTTSVGWTNSICSTGRLAQCLSFPKKTKLPTRTNVVTTPHPEEITKNLRENYQVNTLGDLRDLINVHDENEGWGTIEIPPEWKNKIETILNSEEMKKKCAENDDRMKIENERKIKEIDVIMVRILKKIEQIVGKQKKIGQSRKINSAINLCLRLASPRREKEKKLKNVR